MARMLVFPPAALREIETAIVTATHTATDTAGEKLMLATIDSRTLATAARIALEIATGEIVWPADQTLKLRAPRRTSGIFDIEG